jgi:hypothetical protein
MSCDSQDFTIKQGEDLSLPFYWYDGDPVIKSISAIAAGYPPTLTATGHGLPTNKIPVQLVTIKGPTVLNTDEGETVYALKATTDTFKLPDINAGTMTAYTGGGYLVYQAPKDLTSYTARMQLRSSISSATVLLELTSGNGDIVLGGTEGSATLVLTATQTAALSFSTAVYQLELVSGAGVVKRLASGTITLSKEVTR